MAQQQKHRAPAALARRAAPPECMHAALHAQARTCSAAYGRVHGKLLTVLLLHAFAQATQSRKEQELANLQKKHGVPGSREESQ